MKYSEMNRAQRKLLEDEESYPLRVTFLGKVGILTLEQVIFLREHQVDLDVDDRQAAALLGEPAVEQALAQRAVHRMVEDLQETAETALPPARRRQLQQLGGEAIGGVAGVLGAALRLIRRLLRL